MPRPPVAAANVTIAHTDRRPVDPPPVIELLIFEGTPGVGDPSRWKDVKDITAEYNANFFLFATLEHARAIANGRVQNSAANSPPVLTGMPVSAMTYLDRPREAGYFLFPDLSVRHEGAYRLSFDLHEQTKEEFDKSPGEDDSDGEYFLSQMTIKSQPFIVHSAKKFPGLSSSTHTSRTLSEQGCRIRIRRDVRMRKRPTDSEKAREPDLPPARRSQTPEVHRARSLSNGSDHSAHYADGQRRPSMNDYPPLPPTNHHDGRIFFGPTGETFAQPCPPHRSVQQQQPPPMSPASPHYPLTHASPSGYSTPQAHYQSSRSASQSYPGAAPQSPMESGPDPRYAGPPLVADTLPCQMMAAEEHSRKGSYVPMQHGDAHQSRASLSAPVQSSQPSSALPSLKNLLSEPADIEVDPTPEYIQEPRSGQKRTREQYHDYTDRWAPAQSSKRQPGPVSRGLPSYNQLMQKLNNPSDYEDCSRRYGNCSDKPVVAGTSFDRRGHQRDVKFYQR